MPLILFDITFSKPNPRVLPADTPAVTCEAYPHLQEVAEDTGGITRADIDPADIQTLADLPDGAQLFVESDDPAADTLDDTDDETSAATRIWWKATVVER